ncbi:MAG: ATP-grasp domain-containing protein [Peptococcaceae bacterium]|nr:ATP-grasp domain-containing protein [Peptococcaceae bacterium]MDH7523978.1 ATP-grasp domain-containing protein [Peptococcaceae bacterium]
MKARILVTDGQPRMTLAVVRSLGKKGLEVLAAEKTRFAPALYSKYCSRSLVYPDPKKYPGEFFNWLVESLQKYRCDACMPVDDAALEVVMERREEVEKICHFVLPPVDSYRIAADKGLSVLAAQRAGLLCPETVQPNDLEKLDDIIKRLELPVVIKPRKSSGSRGIKLVKERKELAGVYLRVHKEHPYPIIQEYIPPAAKYSVCLLFNKSSQLRASFVQRQIRHYPVDIGTSVVQESVFFPELVEQGLKLLKDLNWTGIAELEFLVDKQGKAYFMEINPRFWGSLHLAVIAGVDFPWLLYKLAVEGDAEEVNSYKQGIKCRWLLPGDILHFITNKDRLKMDPPFLAGKKRDVYDDILSLDDPLPALGFLLACFRYLLDREMWRFVLKGDYFEKYTDS